MTSPGSAPVTAASLLSAIEAKLRSRHATTDPSAAAGLCMTVVLPVLRGMAAEIERLKTELAAVRALAVAGGVRLAELERVRTAARAGKSGSEEKGRRDG